MHSNLHLHLFVLQYLFSSWVFCIVLINRLFLILRIVFEYLSVVKLFCVMYTVKTYFVTELWGNLSFLYLFLFSLRICYIYLWVWRWWSTVLMLCQPLLWYKTPLSCNWKRRFSDMWFFDRHALAAFVVSAGNQLVYSYSCMFDLCCSEQWILKCCSSTKLGAIHTFLLWLLSQIMHSDVWGCEQSGIGGQLAIHI